MTMTLGTSFVISETFDFVLEHTISISLVALFVFYISFEVSGFGIICQCLDDRRVKKLDDDLERVRELQDQLGMLRTERAKRQLQALKKGQDQPCMLGADNVTKPNSTMDTSKPDNINGLTVSQDDKCDTQKEDLPHVSGAVSGFYESIKDTWTWGRHQTPLGPLLGVAEGITCSTAGLFGTDLKGIDDALKPHVAGLDGLFPRGNDNDDNRGGGACQESNNQLAS